MKRSPSPTTNQMLLNTKTSNSLNSVKHNKLNLKSVDDLIPGMKLPNLQAADATYRNHN